MYTRIMFHFLCQHPCHGKQLSASIAWMSGPAEAAFSYSNSDYCLWPNLAVRHLCGQSVRDSTAVSTISGRYLLTALVATGQQPSVLRDGSVDLTVLTSRMTAACRHYDWTGPARPRGQESVSTSSTEINSRFTD